MSTTTPPPASKALKPVEEMTLTEIASEITRNLKRLEAAQQADRAAKGDRSVDKVRYYQAGAWVAGATVAIQHCYLTLLRAGEAPNFGNERFRAIEAEEREAKHRKKKQKEQDELDARRAGLSPDVVYAVRVPAQVVYVVGRAGTDPLRLRQAAHDGIRLQDPVLVGPEAIPEEDLRKVPIVPRNYLLKDPTLEGKRLGDWPR